MVSQITVSVETCANCGKQIGGVETPWAWREYVVCAACHAILRAAEPAAALCPGAMPVPGRRWDPRRRKRTRRMRKICHVVESVGVLLALAGIGLATLGALELNFDGPSIRVVLMSLALPGLLLWALSFTFEVRYC